MSETKLCLFSWAVAGAVGGIMTLCISALVIGCQSMAAVERDDPCFKYICLAKDKKGQSTAFIMRDNGTNWCVTAEHCVRDGGFRCRNVEGRKPKLGYLDFEVARNADICRFPIDTVESWEGALIASPVVPKIGDEVVVYGNANGLDTICKSVGRVVSVGPERIEIESDWCEGFSGGPVITKDGVVGVIAFYASARKGTETDESKYNKLRRFAYRIDTVNWDTLPYSLYIRAVSGEPEKSLDHR